MYFFSFFLDFIYFLLTHLALVKCISPIVLCANVKSNRMKTLCACGSFTHEWRWISWINHTCYTRTNISFIECIVHRLLLKLSDKRSIRSIVVREHVFISRLSIIRMYFMLCMMYAVCCMLCISVEYWKCVGVRGFFLSFFLSFFWCSFQ